MNKKIFISTGEVSGDLHGSLLSKALLDEAKKKSIDLEICGLGGERMKKEGVKILQDTTSISAIGIWEALPLILPTIRIQKRLYKLLKKYPPDCLILIDYMGPNIKIGTKLKRSNTNIPIFYYIAPQEWAWRVGNNTTTNLIRFSDKIFDINLRSNMSEILKNSKTILWNGPIGVFEKGPFQQGTRQLAKAIAESEAFSLAGGGETIAAINKFINKDEVSYCSTGGGAFLEYMEGKILPSIEALGG